MLERNLMFAGAFFDFRFWGLEFGSMEKCYEGLSYVSNYQSLNSKLQLPKSKFYQILFAK